ncbi:glycosyltransferase family 2 protein [Tumidithrix elongata RA019]|uniref:Glycosyltransferase family 2 protein n=1 Tax=Tumidithrix elongata BACA0141 TaxID=2716417 RepID=A0AAW9PTL0_9CYAN|nr:glycosyltransferase family 2 protein [Tumidithrix elongata RA019]
MAKVSAIVPVYKVEAYIAETIQSVLAQTFQDFELIIVDDESPDRSIEIAREFDDPRIQIVQQKNRGLAGARNTGIRHAKGEYIALLDSDDLWLPQKLEKHIQHLECNPLVGVSYCPSAFIDELGKPLGIKQTPKLTGITPAQVLCRNPIGNGSAPVIRREVFDAIKFQANLYGSEEDFYFDDTFRQSEDIECWLRIALQTNWQFEGIPEALTLYRVNAGGLSANMMKQYEAWERAIAKAQIYAPEFIAKWGQIAKAYQLRYLARRAVRNRDGKAAIKLLHQALGCHWKIILEEPKRTIQTMLAAYFLFLFPLSFYQAIESFTLKFAAKFQK